MAAGSGSVGEEARRVQMIKVQSLVRQVYSRDAKFACLVGFHCQVGGGNVPGRTLREATVLPKKWQQVTTLHRAAVHTVCPTG